jgi:hypothetical protein
MQGNRVATRRVVLPEPKSLTTPVRNLRLRSLLTVYSGCYLCRPSAPYVNLGCCRRSAGGMSPSNGWPDMESDFGIDQGFLCGSDAVDGQLGIQGCGAFDESKGNGP